MLFSSLFLSFNHVSYAIHLPSFSLFLFFFFSSSSRFLFLSISQIFSISLSFSYFLNGSMQESKVLWTVRRTFFPHHYSLVKKILGIYRSLNISLFAVPKYLKKKYRVPKSSNLVQMAKLCSRIRSTSVRIPQYGHNF